VSELPSKPTGHTRHTRHTVRPAYKPAGHRRINRLCRAPGVCGNTTKDYNRYFVSLLATASASDGAAGDALEATLATAASETREWPTDAQFRQALLGHSLYALSSVQLRAFFAGLENHLRDTKAEDQSRVRASATTLNIEHVMPQNWGPNWPLAVGDDDDDVQAAKQRRANAVNALGNLTLTNGKLNSTMRDSPWSSKEGHLRNKSTFLITTASILSTPSDIAWNQQRGWADNWSEENIDVRTVFLVQRALDVWKRPDIDPFEDSEYDEFEAGDDEADES